MTRHPQIKRKQRRQLPVRQPAPRTARPMPRPARKLPPQYRRS